MIKFIKKIFSLNKFYYRLINFIIFFNAKIFNIEYESIPIIHGFIVKKGSGLLKFGNFCKINSSITANPVGLTHKCFFFVEPNAQIIIGNNVGISNSLLFAKNQIVIKDDVLIGGGCQVLDNDFHSLSYQDRILNGDNKVNSASIIIHKGAFIGASSIILKGVSVGERSVVAAGSVVTKSIPNDEIWGGNPAKFIKKLLL
jgi:acetyltransferase-like isoleucine patch superfamily enzyme